MSYSSRFVGRLLYILSLCLMEWAINWPRPSVCVVLMSMIKLESGKSKEEEIYYSSLPKTSLKRPDLFGIMLEEAAAVWEGSSTVADSRSFCNSNNGHDDDAEIYSWLFCFVHS